MAKIVKKHAFWAALIMFFYFRIRFNIVLLYFVIYVLCFVSKMWNRVENKYCCSWYNS